MRVKGSGARPGEGGNISSDKMADQRSRKEYVPRQAHKDPESITNDDEGTRREMTGIDM